MTRWQKQDLSVAGREVVQAVAAGKHTHPGEEIGYVMEGSLVFMIEGKPPVKVVSTYVVETGKPLASPAP